MKDNIVDQIEDVQQIWKQQEVENEYRADKFWDNLSPDDKILAFHSVCKRIFKGDIEERGSYRYVLYDVFGFGPDAYIIGMDCGYMSIHNLLFRGLDAEEQERKELDERLSGKEQEASITTATQTKEKE
jgi:hypothetical protein